MGSSGLATHKANLHRWPCRRSGRVKSLRCQLGKIIARTCLRTVQAGLWEATIGGNLGLARAPGPPVVKNDPLR